MSPHTSFGEFPCGQLSSPDRMQLGRLITVYQLFQIGYLSTVHCPIWRTFGRPS